MTMSPAAVGEGVPAAAPELLPTPVRGSNSAGPPPRLDELGGDRTPRPLRPARGQSIGRNRCRRWPGVIVAFYRQQVAATTCSGVAHFAVGGAMTKVEVREQTICTVPVGGVCIKTIGGVDKRNVRPSADVVAGRGVGLVRI